MYQFFKESTSKFKFRPMRDNTTETLTLNGINATLQSADTICDGISSLMAIGGNDPYFDNATRTAVETVEEA